MNLNAPEDLDTLADYELLSRFILSRDREAFAAIVLRHGRLVMRVCRTVLSDANDADDAFQATFLVFAEKAAKIRSTQCLVGWLHGTAYRTAVRTAQLRRRIRGEQGSECSMSSGENVLEKIAAREHEWVLHEEISRLPDKYRVPLVLCHLKGASREEAAATLNCSVAAVKARLERGRAKLRSRLSSRGMHAMELWAAIAASSGAVTRIDDELVRSTVAIVANGSANIPAGVRELARTCSAGTGQWVAVATSVSAAVLFLVTLGLLVCKTTTANEPLAHVLSVPAIREIHTGFVAASVATGNASPGTSGKAESAHRKATRLLQTSLQAQASMDNYSADVESELLVVAQGVEYPQSQIVQIRKRGSDSETIGKFTFGEEEMVFQRVVSDGKFFSYSLDSVGGPLGSVSTNGSAHSGSVGLQSSSGAFLDGYVRTLAVDLGNERLTAALLNSSNAVWKKSESIDGIHTERVDSVEEFGDIAMWIAPELDCTVIRFTIETPEASITLNDVRIAVIDGKVVPVSGRLSIQLPQKREEYKTTREAVDLSPSFVNAFKMVVPNGTVFHDLDRRDPELERPATAGVWLDGKIVSADAYHREQSTRRLSHFSGALE